MLVLIGLLILVGVLMYFVKTAPFIDGNFKWAIQAVIVIAMVAYLLNYFGIMPHLKG